MKQWLFILATLLLTACSQPNELEVATVTISAEVVPATEVVISAETSPPTATPQPALTDPIFNLDDGWTKIEPGGDTRCAHDTEFAFWARPGSSNKLLVYFQGGGGCWSGDTCRVGSSFYDAAVSNNDAPNGRGGILNFNNPENPFSDYHAIYVPSCTGDIYLGNNVQTYETSTGASIEIYHRGFVNLNSAINWAFENVIAPDNVFVTGCSAGSIGSIRAAPHLIEHYADARVTQLGDSLGFLFSTPAAIDEIYGSHHTLPDWIPAFANFDPEQFKMADLYNAVAANYPEQRFAQYNTERDHVQVRYHTAGGASAETFAPLLADAISDIHSASPNFRSYMADGNVHCIMPGSDFYSREVNGVRFRDWVADLEAGREVDNVQCDECLVNYEASCYRPVKRRTRLKSMIPQWMNGEMHLRSPFRSTASRC